MIFFEEGMFKGNKIGVIIPAHNEEDSIGRLIEKIPGYVDSIFCIDNRSKDRTYEICAQYGATRPVVPLREPETGYGRACLRGIDALSGEEITVFLDADLSDDPASMHLLLKPIAAGKVDFVLSNRFTPMLEAGAMSLPQRWGNKLSVFLIYLLWGHRYRDLGPFRAIKTSALKNLHMEDKNYGWTVEMQIKAAEQQLRIREIGLPYYRRDAGKSKVSRNIRGIVRAGSKILFTIFKLAFIRSVS